MTYTLDESHTSRNFTPAANVMATFGYPRDIKWITIHHWGNNGQQFNIVRDYLCTNTTPTSAHFVAEDGQVACIVSPLDAAWHAGNAQGNAQSIGIECRPEHTDGDYQTVGELVAWLRTQYGDLPLVPHNHWTSTACPGDYDLNRIDAIARGTTPQATAITPITEDFLMALTDDEQRRLLAAADRINGTIPDRRDPNGNPYTVLLSDDGGTITNMLGQTFTKADGAWQNDNLGALVWNTKVNGPSTAAGVLNHIDQKPAATNAVTGAPFDVDAFINRIVATLPAATVAAIKNAL